MAGIIFFLSCKREYSCEECIGNNKPPVAVAGTDTVITLPLDSVLLDGSKSSDQDGKITEWQWTKLNGPASFNISNPSDSITVVKNLVAGTYQFELKVTDNGGHSAKDTVQISVSAVNNRPPIADAGNDTTIILPVNSIILNGSGSTDPDNNITGYAWTKISGPSSFNIVNANAVQTQVTNLVEGVYLFELKVTDAGGLFSKDTIQVTVQPAQQDVCDLLNRATITIQLIPVAAIPTPKYFGFTTATAGNKLLLAGGRAGPGGNPVSDVDMYDFDTQTWSTAHLSTPRAEMTAVTVRNKILFVGGEVPGSYGTTRMDIYDASVNIWSFSDMPSTVGIPSYAVAGNKVFFAGDGKVDVYDTSTGLWSELDLPEHQNNPTVTTAGDKVYFAGGSVSVVNIYDNATGAWSTASPLSQTTGGMGSIYVNGKIYWAGGTIGYDVVNDRPINTCKVEIRDVSTGSSSFTNLSAPNLFDGFEGDERKPIYYNNKIFFRGWRGNYYFDIYDPQSSTWSIGQFPQNVFIESVILVNNALYAIGAYNDSSGTQLSNQIWKLQY